MNDNKTHAWEADQIQDEHQRLGHVLRGIRDTIGGRGVSTVRLTEMLVELSLVLQEHFIHEEGDGFFDDIVRQAPRLQRRAEALRQQHGAMREQLRDLRRIAERQESNDSIWDELQAAFANFHQVFHQHEEGENALLQEAYGQDIGERD